MQLINKRRVARAAAGMVLIALMSLTHVVPALARKFYWCSFPDGSEVRLKWNVQPGSKITFFYDTSLLHTEVDQLKAVESAWNASSVGIKIELKSTTQAVGANNGRNEIWVGSGIGTRAHALIEYDLNGQLGTGFIREADIVFNSDFTLSTSSMKIDLAAYGGSGKHFSALAFHEFGHALGQGHEWETHSVMGEPEGHVHTNGASVTSYSGEDTIGGFSSLYAAGTGEDLAVQHWGLLDYGNDRTTVHNLQGDLLHEVDEHSAEPRYKVRADQRIVVKFTIENNGTVDQETKVGFFLSDDDLIDSTDRSLGSFSMDIDRDVADLKGFEVDVPDDVEPGQNYYLGAIVDLDGQLAEIDEANNATYVGVQICSQSASSEHPCD